MPVHTGKDSKGCYAQWGKNGKKYYYTCGNEAAMNKAKQKAHIQQAAAEKAGYKENATWTTAFINDLPDGSFLYISPGGKKENGKTTPRSLRHFPYKDKSGKIDLPHLRNALARIPQSNVPASAKKAATAKAQRLLKSATRNEAANQIQHVTINIRPNVRYDTMEGREYLVVPCISIVEGVHNGSTGPLYYPAEELKKTPQVWNAKPVVVYHPEINGVGVSACEPEILTTRKVGTMMNTQYDEDSGGLSHEIWIDTAKAEHVDNRILEAIQNQEIMEVSTGLFTDNEYVEGDWEGEPYVAIARNYRPDHLALLPDKIGACSVEDGAGLMRVNEGEDGYIKPPEMWSNDFSQFLEAVGIDVSRLRANELSHSDVRQQLYAAVHTSDADGSYIEEVFDDYFIYSRNGKLYKRNYSVKKDVVTVTGIPEQVVRVIQYKTANGVFLSNTPVTLNTRKEKKMNKIELIQAIIENEGTRFTEDDKEYLESQEIESLEKFMPPEKKKEEPVIKNEPEPKPEVKAEAPKTLEQLLAEADSDTQDMIRNGVASYKADKKRLINTITANDRNQFTAEQLEDKQLGELKAIAALATTKQASYEGLGETVGNMDTVGELPIPKAIVTAPLEK